MNNDSRAANVRSADGELDGPPRVLVVDDETIVSRAIERVLQRAGFHVETCSDAGHAIEILRERPFDAVLSDVAMPGMNGVDLLRAIRADDKDIPVLLVTGDPSLESAVAAVELGAFKYVTKPFETAELVAATTRAAQLCRLARTKREALAVLGSTAGEASDRAGLEESFKRALGSLWVAFQPIVDSGNQTVFAYEALLRSDEPALPHPGAVLDAAERLGELQTLGRAVRAEAASRMADAHPTWLLFLNLHPEDLLDPHLLDGANGIGAFAHRVVLEITERASLDRIPDIGTRIAALREAGFRIAVDDLGAGYAGLSSFVHLEPEFVKLDMSLVRGVHESAVKRRLVATMTGLCRELGQQVVAEGVETPEERDVLVELGCDLLQGFHFGKPARSFIEARW